MKAHVENSVEFTISACVIAKNEEKTIATSINSYKKYVDEIIVVDTGSTDDTVKIAESLGSKVLHFEWCDDFAAAKNVALNVATGDWIIFLDADEYFADNTCSNLRSVIHEAILKNKNAIGCRMENIDSDNMTGIIDSFCIRTFKAGTRYQYAIHEDIFNSEGLNVLIADKSRFYLKHTGYSSLIVAKKCERNLEMMLKELELEKNERRIIKYYAYISDAYFGMGKYKECRDYANKFIEQSAIKKIRLLGCDISQYMNIIKSLEIERAEFELSAPYIKNLTSMFPGSPDASYMCGCDFKRRYLFYESLMNFNEALKLSENCCGAYVDTVWSHKSYVYNNCGMCEEALLHTAEAMEWYFKALKEAEDYQTALFNLLRAVRCMPQKEIDPFVESLYLGKSVKIHIAIMSSLMCNYMVSQLIKCYNAYHTDKKSDTFNDTVNAFILAGSGEYSAASKLFILNYSVKKNKDTLMRCLLCSVLSDDKELIAQALEICNPVQAFALGLSEKPELTIDDVFDISTIYIECSRLGQIDFVTSKIDALANQLDDKQLMRLSDFLADGFAFEAALCVAQHAATSADSVFMQGYLLYRMRRLYEAVELLLLAKHMGYDKPAFDEIYGNIVAVREKSGSELSDEKKVQLKAQIEQKIRAGNFGGAATDIETYMRVAEPDTEIFTAQVTLLYYRGEFKKAAIAAECGLLKDENNFDLLYNAGCVYEKLGDFDRAKVMYSKALKNCKDNDIANELKQILGVTN